MSAPREPRRPDPITYMAAAAATDSGRASRVPAVLSTARLVVAVHPELAEFVGGVEPTAVPLLLACAEQAGGSVALRLAEGVDPGGVAVEAGDRHPVGRCRTSILSLAKAISSKDLVSQAKRTTSVSRQLNALTAE